MENVSLVKVRAAHWIELVSWVTTEGQLYEWAGPNVQYSCDALTLKQDLLAKSWPAFSLISANGELLGFGQYYSRLGRCHLCRLIIAPCHRSKGLAQTLIARISDIGEQEMGVTSCSLFVYQQNLAAIKAYQKIGFRVVDYPGNELMDNGFYMVKL